MSLIEIEALKGLVQEVLKDDPTLYDILSRIVDNLYTTAALVEPLQRQSTASSVVPEIPLAPESFTYQLTPQTVRFFWSQRPGVSQYEVRRGNAGWETADFVFRSSALQADISPLPTGSYTFLIKSVDIYGRESQEATSLLVTIGAVGGVTISVQVIDNNVLLSWTAASGPFAIDHYDVYKGGSLFGEVSGSFCAIFETVAGTYTYKVIGVDVAGNQGPDSIVTVDVNAPPDFVLQATQTSTFSGTKTNVLLYAGKLLCCVPTTTWQQHFNNWSFASPNAQVVAGYPIYIQPTENSGSYVETFDFGAVFNNVIANIDWSYNVITDAVAVGCQIEFSQNGSNWDTPISGTSGFSSAMRYLRLTLNFTGADNTSLMELWNLRILLDVKQEVDSGDVNALAANPDGTTVTFAKAFKDVNSITLTPQSTKEPLHAIYDFDDVPNPTGFTVFVFDSSGNRVDALVSWKARGIV